MTTPNVPTALVRGTGVLETYIPYIREYEPQIKAAQAAYVNELKKAHSYWLCGNAAAYETTKERADALRIVLGNHVWADQIGHNCGFIPAGPASSTRSSRAYTFTPAVGGKVHIRKIREDDADEQSTNLVDLETARQDWAKITDRICPF